MDSCSQGLRYKHALHVCSLLIKKEAKICIFSQNGISICEISRASATIFSISASLLDLTHDQKQLVHMFIYIKIRHPFEKAQHYIFFPIPKVPQNLCLCSCELHHRCFREIMVK